MTRRNVTFAGMCLAAGGLAAPALAGGVATFYTDPIAFNAAVIAAHKDFKTAWDFKPNFVAAGSILHIENPLDINTHPVNAPGMWQDAVGNNVWPDDFDNIQFFGSEIPGQVVPPGVGCYLATPGFLGIDNNMIGVDFFNGALNVISGPPAGDNHTAIALEILDPFGTIINVNVYGKDELGLGTITIQQNPSVKSFLGVVVPASNTIGRIEIFSADGGAPGVSFVEAYLAQPPSCPWDCGIPHNKVVDVVDLLALLAQYDVSSPIGCTGGTCDFNGDGCVDVVDLLKLLGQWGQACPPPPNDECAGKIFLFRDDPAGQIVEPFDMYGATPSPEPWDCAGVPNTHKDIWYCLRNATNFEKLVTVTGTVDLSVEVRDGCQCAPPGGLYACGLMLFGGTTFAMLPGQEVCIRLLNDLDLPNDLIKGDLIILNEPIGVPSCPAGSRIDFGVTLDDTGNPNACPGPISITTQYLNTQRIVFGLAVNNFNPPDVVIIDDGACSPACRSAGTPVYTGDWWCEFRIATPPVGSIPAGVTSFSADVCFIDAPPGTILMEGYNNNRQLVANAFNTVNGAEVLTIVAPPGELIAYVRVVSSDPARGGGLSIDCLAYPDPIPRIPDEVNFYLDPVLYFDAVFLAGKTEKLFWDFTPSNPSCVVIDSPLDIFTHGLDPADPWTDPLGVNLWPPFVDNLQFVPNLLPQGPFEPAFGPNFLGFVNTAFGPCLPDVDNNFLLENIGSSASFDIISGPPSPDDNNHTAIAFEVMSIFSIDPGFQPVLLHITVYDKNEQEIGKFLLPTFNGFKNFVGILSKDPALTIGRIDIWDELGGFEGISAIWAFNQPIGGQCDNCDDGAVNQCNADGTCHDCETPLGDCLCVDARGCDMANACDAAGNCPAGEVCCTNTCCGFPICLTPCSSPAEGGGPEVSIPGQLMSDGHTNQ